MKTLTVVAPQTLELKDVPVPDRQDHCLIRIKKAGICGTDLQILDGYADFRGTPGHEFVGVVESAPARDAAWVGKRVVGDINIGCGNCPWCARGVKEHCLNRTVVGIRGHDGAFAEFLTLPAANLHAIPDAMDDETAVFVEPTAAACRIFEQMTIAPNARVAVLGDGRMGLLVAQVLKTAAADVTLLGRHDRKLDTARSLGLDARRSDEPVPLTSRYDVVVDATGRPAGLKRSLEIVQPRGTVVMKSTFHGEAPLESWPIVVDEVTLLGSRCGPFARAIDVLSSGDVSVKPLISGTFSLEQHPAAFAEAHRGLKVLFTF